VGPHHHQDGGHPPFGTQIILNGHEYVACQATKRHLSFTKEDNCFTQIANATHLARCRQSEHGRVCAWPGLRRLAI